MKIIPQTKREQEPLDSQCFPGLGVLFSHVQFCDPMHYSPPGSSVRGILQARILE